MAWASRSPPELGSVRALAFNKHSKTVPLVRPQGFNRDRYANVCLRVHAGTWERSRNSPLRSTTVGRGANSNRLGRADSAPTEVASGRTASPASGGCPRVPEHPWLRSLCCPKPARTLATPSQASSTYSNRTSLSRATSIIGPFGPVESLPAGRTTVPNSGGKRGRSQKVGCRADRRTASVQVLDAGVRFPPRRLH